MKNKNILLVILALTLVFAMTAVGCDNGTTDKNNTPKPITFKSSDTSGSTYTLTITPQTANEVAEGDSYVLTITNGSTSQVSKGTITNITNGVLTMKPNNSGTPPEFTVTMTGQDMTAINGTITVGEGEGTSVTAPGTVTPGSNNNNNNNGGGEGNASDFTYTETVNAVTITGYKGFLGSSVTITIPAQINGKPVTRINTYAFDGQSNPAVTTNLTGVNIPDSVVSIGEGAFRLTAWLNNQPDGVVYAGKVAYTYKGDMPANTSITLLEGTKGIAGGAFNYQTNLTGVIIPDSVVSIGGGAFDGTAWFNNKSSGVVYAGKVAYNHNVSSTSSVTLQDGTKGIAERAFSNQKLSGTITIPDSVSNIGLAAFNGSLQLTSVTIGNGVTSIESYTFMNCSGLTSVTIGNKVTSIGERAFTGCSKLASVTIPASVLGIEGGAFYECASLTSVTFQGTITEANFKVSYTSSLTFPGDLRAKYLAGGIGTYTRSGAGTTASPYVWTKS